MKEINKDIERLCKAIEWGFDINRPAWKRVLLKAKQKADSWPSERLVSVRQEILDQSPQLISEWYRQVVSLGADLAEISAFDGNPEGLWQELYYMNYGIFGLGSDPLDGFLITVPSLKKGEYPLLLSPKADGWGI
jgi:hypothetical protein